MGKRYLVQLSTAERDDLRQQFQQSLTARQRRRIQTLLLADEGETDETIAEELDASIATVERTRKRFAREGLQAVLTERPRSGKPRKLDGKQEALLVALACSEAPAGQARWTARLLAQRFVELEVVETLSEDTVRRVLKKKRP
jgi:transposase